MPLRSLWFRGDARLQQCLFSDPQHVKLGDRGPYVLLIQQALQMLESASIDRQEIDTCYYGSSTARAVLSYKTKRKIINYSYQAAADDIVGRMTIQHLDDEMVAKEQSAFHLLLAFGFQASKAIVISELNSPWREWAQQFSKADSGGRAMVTMANGASPQTAASVIKAALNQAGGGAICLSVGHGRGAGRGDDGGQTLWGNEGYFDLAPGNTFRIGGANALLPGDPPPKNAKPPYRYVQTSAFYDFRFHPQDLTRKEWDEQNIKTVPAAKIRLRNWSIYEDVCSSFKNSALLGVVLLTCRVGKSVDFLRRVAKQWNKRIVAYRRRVVGDFVVSRRARVFLKGDMPGSGTNIPFGEVCIPFTWDVLFRGEMAFVSP